MEFGFWSADFELTAHMILIGQSLSERESKTLDPRRFFEIDSKWPYVYYKIAMKKGHKSAKQVLQKSYKGCHKSAMKVATK